MPLEGCEPGALLHGRYRVVRELGEGGAACVFLARDLDSGRLVALKVVRDRGGEASRNLVHEAEALGRLHHPRIVALEASGVLPDGRAFLATGYVPGKPLRAILRDGPLALTQVLQVGAAVADAIAAIHACGMLHRDLKPDNVIVPIVNERPVFMDAVLIDLGVFGALGERAPRGGARTRWGRVSGTPWYMAPEQLAGRPQTPATDVYGLGVLLYELLFGFPPMADAAVMTVTHPGDGSFMAYAGSFVQRRLTETVDLPARPHVPRPVRDLIARLLRIPPDRRPASADSLANTLRSLAATGPGP